MSLFTRLATLVGLIGALASIAAVAHAQEEFPPPQGKGRIVVVASGMSGVDHYRAVSREIAKLGYDVMLFDGNSMENTRGQGVKDAILKAEQAPHGLPGKVAIVGFSLGGGESLFWATPWDDQIAGVIEWYPATGFIQHVDFFVSRLKMPVLMFAGEADHFRDGCCLASKAHVLADAATAAGKDFQLYTYPGADHDFVIDGAHYDKAAYDDAFAKTADRLKQYLGD
jgi:dienelactone hydrolase